MEKDLLILVDRNDQEIGTMSKLEAHREGLLHRAFSILVWNSKGEMLIHKRAVGKYHSEGLWTNACCSHPMPGETISEAAHRRLREEMGFDCELEEAFSFIYKEALDNGLTEHELDHVLTGNFDGIPDPDPTEVWDYRWISMDDLSQEIEKNPQSFTCWFKLIVGNHLHKMKV